MSDEFQVEETVKRVTQREDIGSGLEGPTLRFTIFYLKPA